MPVVAIPTWTPVEEQLPEDGQDVAIVWRIGNQVRLYAATYRAPDEYRDYPIWGGWGEVYPWEHVTHWCALPEVP